MLQVNKKPLDYINLEEEEDDWWGDTFYVYQPIRKALEVCFIKILILYIKTEFAICVPVSGFFKSRIRHEYLLFWFPKFIILCLNS